MATVNATETENEVSQPTLEFTSLLSTEHTGFNVHSEDFFWVNYMDS